MTVLTLEDEGLKVALIYYLTYLGSYLGFTVFCFLNPMSYISMMLSYFFSIRLFFLSYGLPFVILMVFSLFALVYSTLDRFMLVADFTC